MGEISVPNDGMLSYYSTAGKLLANYKTNLHDITGLAYSPGDAPQLYAVDFAWADTKQGGLFQIVRTEGEDKPGIEAIRLLDLMKPTAMAFDKDGALYVTVIGESEDGTTGQLLKIENLEEE